MLIPAQNTPFCFTVIILKLDPIGAIHHKAQRIICSLYTKGNSKGKLHMTILIHAKEIVKIHLKLPEGGDPCDMNFSLFP